MLRANSVSAREIHNKELDLAEPRPTEPGQFAKSNGNEELLVVTVVPACMKLLCWATSKQIQKTGWRR